MSGFMYEVKKIMLCQRGLFYIALVLLLGTVWLALSDNPVDIAMELMVCYRYSLDRSLRKATPPKEASAPSLFFILTFGSRMASIRPWRITLRQR